MISSWEIRPAWALLARPREIRPAWALLAMPRKISTGLGTAAASSARPLSREKKRRKRRRRVENEEKPVSALRGEQKLQKARAAPPDSFDSLATGWLSGRRREREERRRRVENEEKHLFPWVSDKWTDLKRADEQKRQNKRQAIAPCGRLNSSRMRCILRSCVHSTLRYLHAVWSSAWDALYDLQLFHVHKKPKALIEKEIMEDTSGWVDGTMRANNMLGEAFHGPPSPDQNENVLTNAINETGILYTI